MRAYEFIQETAVIDETPLPANRGQVLSWHSLDEGLSLADKISIFEEYHINGNLTESLDEDKTNYFMSLFKMSDEPKRGRKFIVAPLSLIGNRILTLDKPSVMEYLGKDNGQLVFKYKDKEITYPSKTMRDLSLFHTFTFLNSDTYNKFRMALSLKFDTDLPEVNSRINEDQDLPTSAKYKTDAGGIQLDVSIDGATVDIRAMAMGRQLGYVVFGRDGGTLVPDDLAVDERFRGQGIASIMYDHAKDIGFTIRRSNDQTDAGRKFWDKYKPYQNIWEEEIINEVPLPPDWDKEVYKGKGTFKDRIRYAVERAKKIGTGSSRVAFIIEYEGRPTVLKIAKNKKGLAQNNVEADILSDYYAQSLGITIPIIDYDEENPEPLWIHTELAEKANEKKLCEIMKCEKLFYLTELVKAILGNDPFWTTASKALAYIKEKTNMSDQDLNVLEEYASRIADLVGNFDLSVGDISVPQNWGIYKGKPVLIDVGLSDTVWSSLYDKTKTQPRQAAGAGQGGGWVIPLKR